MSKLTLKDVRKEDFPGITKAVGEAQADAFFRLLNDQAHQLTAILNSGLRFADNVQAKVATVNISEGTIVNPNLTHNFTSAPVGLWIIRAQILSSNNRDTSDCDVVPLLNWSAQAGSIKFTSVVGCDPAKNYQLTVILLGA